MNPISVVAGICVRDGRILVARRREGGAESRKWEFPGGKIEPGETPEEALERELSEELGVKTKTGRIFDAVIRYLPERAILILFYFTSLTQGEPRPIEAEDVMWLLPEELGIPDFAEADRRVADRLRAEMIKR